uniref:Uncharacterized protein n=1 Tax=Tetranychus urticae TaxID=32264 RepID=T1KG13_TETUR
MDNPEVTLESVFNEISQTLIGDYRFNSKLVNERVARLEKFTRKVDDVLFSFFKKCVGDFLEEEEKIYEEISGNLDEDELLTKQIIDLSNEIEDTIDDTRKIIEQSHELSRDILTINSRTQSYNQIQQVISKLKETMKQTKDMVPVDQEAVIIDAL